MRKGTLSPLFLGLLLGGALARADVWDVQTNADNGAATGNELMHGSDQLHDLGALPGPMPDEDWYSLSQRAYSAYEVVLDATSGDIGSALLLERIGSDGSVAQTAVPIGSGSSHSLRFRRDSTAEVEEHVRVRSGSCTTSCGPEDVYRIRTYDTTCAVPRFNNTGSQVTVLTVQNPTRDTVDLTVYFWSTAGALLAMHSPSALAPNGALTLNTATVPGAAGQGGAITITHTARYGELAGKAVALEPATGFTFDTPMTPWTH